jgi:hypothetical protein
MLKKAAVVGYGIRQSLSLGNYRGFLSAEVECSTYRGALQLSHLPLFHYFFMTAKHVNVDVDSRHGHGHGHGYGTWTWNLTMDLGHGPWAWNLDIELRHGT